MSRGSIDFDQVTDLHPSVRDVIVRSVVHDFVSTQICDQKTIDDQTRLFFHHRLASTPTLRSIERVERLDGRSKESISVGMVYEIAGLAGRIFRSLRESDYGIDGEIEFCDGGHPTGRKIYLQLKFGDGHLRTRSSDGKEIFDIKNRRHIRYWQDQTCPVYLMIVESSGRARWMNVTSYLRDRPDQESQTIVFEGVTFDVDSVLEIRDHMLNQN